MEVAEVKDVAKVQLKSLQGVGRHQDIVKIDKTK